MADERSKIPTEVELVYEVMPCNAMRVAEGAGLDEHSCAYFRKWGTYHSYDYVMDRAPSEGGILHDAKYVGRRWLLPELLSGCRKAPIMAVGINPNLPAWWSSRRRTLFPDFDDFRQFAHYFRYRATDKVELSGADYAGFGGGPTDGPFSDSVLDVPVDDDGNRLVQLRPQNQTMYSAYEALLSALAEKMGWEEHRLAVGEDLSYGNMVACPSAKWTTRADPNDPLLPPMTSRQQRGIVDECFRERAFFPRQLFQSLPKVLLVFSNSTARALITELEAYFVEGEPRPDETIESLMTRPVRLAYGDVDGESIEARIIFSPHITGSQQQFAAAREMVAEQLAEEARIGHLELNGATGHLRRPRGSCVMCPMLEIGECDYASELVPLSGAPALTAEGPIQDLLADKRIQDLMRAQAGHPRAGDDGWKIDDDRNEEDVT